MHTKNRRQAGRNGIDHLGRLLRQLWLADFDNPAAPFAADTDELLALDDALGRELGRRLTEVRERLKRGPSVQTMQRLRKDLQRARGVLQAAAHRHDQAEAALREALRDGAPETVAAAREKRAEAAARRTAAADEVTLLSDLVRESEAAVDQESSQAKESLMRTLLAEAEAAADRALERLRGMVQAKAFQAALREYSAARRMASLATARQIERPPAPLQLFGMRWWTLDAALRELGADRLAEDLLAE